MKNVKGLRMDLESAEGEFHMPPELLAESSTFQLDVMNDWLYDIEKCCHEVELEFIAKSQGISVEEAAKIIEDRSNEMHQYFEKNLKGLVGMTIVAVGKTESDDIALKLNDGSIRVLFPTSDSGVHVASDKDANDEPIDWKASVEKDKPRLAA